MAYISKLIKSCNIIVESLVLWDENTHNQLANRVIDCCWLICKICVV